MFPVNRHPALLAVFNVANLNAAGGFLLSRGTGSTIGSMIFGGAVAVGSYNKYKTLTSAASLDAQQLRERNARDTSITAKILMGAAAWNCISATADVFTQGPESRPANIGKALCWAFGVAGDNAIRRLDKMNFQQAVAGMQKIKSRLRLSFEAAVANPPVFYSASVASLTASMLLEKNPSPLQMGFGMAVIGLCTAGVAHVVRRTAQAARGDIALDKINDGVVNAFSAGAAVGQGVLAALGGNRWVAAACTVFAGAVVKALYETRSALHKKNQSGSAL